MTSSAPGATWQRLVSKALVSYSSAQVIKAPAVWRNCPTSSKNLKRILFLLAAKGATQSWPLPSWGHGPRVTPDSVCAVVGSAWGGGVVCRLGPTRCLGELWRQRAAHGVRPGGLLLRLPSSNSPDAEGLRMPLLLLILMKGRLVCCE